MTSVRRFAWSGVAAAASLCLSCLTPFQSNLHAQERPADQPQTRQQGRPGGEEQKEAGKEAPKETPIPPEKSSVTHHELSLGGKSLKYTATAGTLLIRDEEDKPYGSMFYVAYTLDGADPATTAGEFSLQRRSWIGNFVVAYGFVLAGANRDGQSQGHGWTAVQAGAESVFAARQDGPGVYRCAADGVLARGG